MLLAAFLCLGAQAQAPVHVTVTNPSKEARKDVPVVIDIRQWGDVKKAVVTVDGKEVPSQLDDIDRDCVNDELCFLVDLDKKEIKEVSVLLLQEGDQTAYPARTFAELVLPSRNKNWLKMRRISICAVSHLTRRPRILTIMSTPMVSVLKVNW